MKKWTKKAEETQEATVQTTEETGVPQKSKGRRIANTIINIVLVIAIILAAVCTYTSYVSTSGNGVPSIFGLRVMSIQTESMYPTMKPGDLIFDTAVKDTDQQRYQRTDHTDSQRNTAADPDTGKNVSSQIIQTEDMLQSGPLIGNFNVLLIIGMRINIRCKDAHKHDDKKKNQARHGDFIFPESSECILPVGNAGAHQIL